MIKTEHRQINDGYKLKESHLNDRRHELETKANGHQSKDQEGYSKPIR